MSARRPFCTRAVTACLLLAPGCGGPETKRESPAANANSAAATTAAASAQPPPADGATPAKPADSVEPAAKETPKPLELPKLSKSEFEEAKRSRARYSRLLNDGRTLSKAGDYGAAMKKFAEADAIVPGHPAALGEHGWAAFKAGDLGLAESKTRLAVANASEPKRKAAALYNLGRIEEARGNAAGAKDHYARSLSLRANQTVASRLEGLTEAAAKGGEEAPPQASVEAALEAMCAEAKADWLCDLGDADCSCDPELEVAGDGKGPGIRAAALLTLNGHGGDGGDLAGTKYLALQGPDGRWVNAGMVGYCYLPGVAYIQNDCAVEIDLGDHLDAPGHELIVESFGATSDLNPGVGPFGEAEYSEERTWMLCRAVGGHAHCMSLLRQGSMEVEALDPTLFDGEPLTPEEKREADKQASASAWALAIELARDATIEITVPKTVTDVAGSSRDNDLDSDRKKLVGNWSLADFEALEGVEVLNFGRD